MPKTELLRELAARLGVPQLPLDAHDAVGLALEDGTWLDLQFLDDETLRVACDLGTVTAPARQGFLLAALLLNNELAELGLPCLAYSATHGSALLCQSLRTAGGDPAGIAEKLHQMAGLARALKTQGLTAQVLAP